MPENERQPAASADGHDSHHCLIFIQKSGESSITLEALKKMLNMLMIIKTAVRYASIEFMKLTKKIFLNVKNKAIKYIDILHMMHSVLTMTQAGDFEKYNKKRQSLTLEFDFWYGEIQQRRIAGRFRSRIRFLFVSIHFYHSIIS